MKPSADRELERFVEAQASVIDAVRRELADGRKRTHWMWFVFPQIHGLGRSETARHFAIRSRAEAEAYLRHPVLGARLRDCVELLLAVQGRTAHEIFDSPDDLKLHSCLTLFDAVDRGADHFDRALARFFAGRRDTETLDRLAEDAG